MTFQSEFQAAGEQYAAALDKQRETERLDALRLEVRKHSNGSAFAQAIEEAFDRLDESNTLTDDTQEN